MMDSMESFGVGLLVCLGIGLAYFVIKIIPYYLDLMIQMIINNLQCK